MAKSSDTSGKESESSAPDRGDTSGAGSASAAPSGKGTDTSGKSTGTSAAPSGKGTDTSGASSAGAAPSGKGGDTSGASTGTGAAPSGKGQDTSGKESGQGSAAGEIGGSGAGSQGEAAESVSGSGSGGDTGSVSDSVSKAAATGGLSAGIGAALSKSFGAVGDGLDASTATAAAAGLGGLGGGSISAAAKAAQYDTAKAVADTSEAARDAQLAGLATGIGEAVSRTVQPQYAKTAETVSSVLGTLKKAEGADYNTLSGGATADITSMTIAEAMEFAKTSWPGKIAPVVGAYQIKDTTLPIAAEWAGLPLDTVMTPAVQDQLALGLIAYRADRATVDGVIDVDKFASELSKEWASLATKDGTSYYADNGIDKASVDYDTTYGIASSLAGLGTPTATGTTSPQAADVQEPTSFATTYLGHTPQGGIEDSANKYDRQIAQETSFFGAPVDHVDRGVQPNMPSTVPATKSNPDPVARPLSEATGVAPSSTAETVPPTSSATPVSPSTPDTVRPSTPETVKPSTPETVKPSPLTTAETLAAMGIDVGLGLIPGVGIALSVVNGGLMLTGNDTIGQMIMRGGEGGTVPTNGDPDRPDPALVVDTGTDVEDEPVEEEEPVTDFASTYLDTTVRPTPAEKWDSGYSSTYAYSEYG